MDSDNQPNRNVFSFTGVEELEEAAQSLGWNIEYRQLGRGKFSAEFASMECDGISMSTERVTNHLQVDSEPPEGFVGFFFMRYKRGNAVTCGKTWNEGDLAAFPSGSELEIITNVDVCNETLFLPERDFLAAARSLAPSAPLIFPSRSAAIIHGDPHHFEKIVRKMDALHAIGVLDRESASHLLTQTVLWMTESAGKTSARRLSNGVAAVIARRAQSYIEDHLCDSIRMQDVCAHAGAGIRTVQRCFASQFQISPTAYIKARRLNSARRELAAADPKRDSVTRIAMKNGFTQLGRFSVEYRAHFGESPKETLAS